MAENIPLDLATAEAWLRRFPFGPFVIQMRTPDNAAAWRIAVNQMHQSYLARQPRAGD